VVEAPLSRRPLPRARTGPASGTIVLRNDLSPTSQPRAEEIETLHRLMSRMGIPMIDEKDFKRAVARAWAYLPFSASCNSFTSAGGVA
jgi:hypothetical protein